MIHHLSIAARDPKYAASVLAELMGRWKARHRHLFLTVNLANDPAKEASKYAWLKARDIITEEEHAEALAAIRANATQSAQRAPEVVLN